MLLECHRGGAPQPAFGLYLHSARNGWFASVLRVAICEKAFKQGKEAAMDPEIVRQQQEAEREAMKLAALKPPTPVLANSQIPAWLEQISVMATKTWVVGAIPLGLMLPALVSVPRR